MISFSEIDRNYNLDYTKLLKILGKLSKLFSDSDIPYINYRVVENAFCKCFNATNLSRSDTAFDAKYNEIGVGIKTFISRNNHSLEKISEFNRLSNEISILNGMDLALELARLRNSRMDLACNLYGVKKSVYHIVARDSGVLRIFESDYDKIDINNIQLENNSGTTFKFNDNKNVYSYNFTKSTLYKKFDVPHNAEIIELEVIDDPYALLLELYEAGSLSKQIKILVGGVDYVVLPLYGRGRIVHEKSGLNQWNAGGRTRKYGEVYIPIPSEIHEQHPGFFPSRNDQFSLITPSGDIMDAKVCQDNSKALMSNPNTSLADWLLRKLLQLNEGELATIDKLDQLGFDSVIIVKDKDSKYRIDKAKTSSYEEFVSGEFKYDY